MSEERKIHVFTLGMDGVEGVAGKVADVLHSLSLAFLGPYADPVAFRGQFHGVGSNDVVVLWHKERLVYVDGTTSSSALTGRDSRYRVWLAEAHARFGTSTLSAFSLPFSFPSLSLSSLFRKFQNSMSSLHCS